MILTYSEQLAVEKIQAQTAAQLIYTLKTFESLDFDGIDYVVIPQNRVAVTVTKAYFMTSLLMELEYRGME